MCVEDNIAIRTAWFSQPFPEAYRPELKEPQLVQSRRPSFDPCPARRPHPLLDGRQGAGRRRRYPPVEDGPGEDASLRSGHEPRASLVRLRGPRATADDISPKVSRVVERGDAISAARPSLDRVLTFMVEDGDNGDPLVLAHGLPNLRLGEKARNVAKGRGHATVVAELLEMGIVINNVVWGDRRLKFLRRLGQSYVNTARWLARVSSPKQCAPIRPSHSET